MGLPPKPLSRSPKSKASPASKVASHTPLQSSEPITPTKTTQGSSFEAPQSSQAAASSTPSQSLASPSTPSSSSPPLPRVIPLHGTLSTLHCPLCHTKSPLLPHLPLPPSTIPCPTCSLASSLRSALSERARRQGSLRPSVVLYGEEHPQGDLIGSQVERDLRGTGGRLREGKVDFVLVAGTSLLIPGVKRIVKEMCKAVKGQAQSGAGKATKRLKTVFVNDEPPKNGSEWHGVFDIWVQGDVQEFVQLLGEDEWKTTPKSTPSKTPWKTVKAPRTPKTTKSPKTPTALKTAKSPKSPRTPKTPDVPTTPTKKKQSPKKALPPTPKSMVKSEAKPTTTDVRLEAEKVTPIKQRMAEIWPLTPRATPPSPSRTTDSKRKRAVEESPSKRRRKAPVEEVIEEEREWATPLSNPSFPM